MKFRGRRICRAEERDPLSAQYDPVAVQTPGPTLILCRRFPDPQGRAHWVCPWRASSSCRRDSVGLNVHVSEGFDLCFQTALFDHLPHAPPLRHVKLTLMAAPPPRTRGEGRFMNETSPDMCKMLPRGPDPLHGNNTHPPNPHRVRQRTMHRF